ncbi:helicase associated domain-containing protein [Streptomyces sp. 1222.5]|uniref:helicase associated domain-containing protein n=1 Tax=Streptomyces sp. 1222.5 TaxID=1881026 RepID=UPI003D75A15D
MDWQRHHRNLADLAADEPGGRPSDIAPGVLMDGDDLGRWLQRQKQPDTWKQLAREQQQRLTGLGVTPRRCLPPRPTQAQQRARGRPGTRRRRRSNADSRPSPSGSNAKDSGPSPAAPSSRSPSTANPNRSRSDWAYEYRTPANDETGSPHSS